MPKFMMILVHAPDTYARLTPEQRQATMERYGAWSEAFRANGHWVASEKLAEEGGKRVSKSAGKLTVVDGPFSEAKEIVGGFIVFRAENYEQAAALIRDCPFLEDGRIELRQTDPMGCGGD